MDDSGRAEQLKGIAAFLSRRRPFKALHADEIDAVAPHVKERLVRMGECVLIEDGPPSTALYVVRSGSFSMARREKVVDVLGPGEVFGLPALLTGLAPQFTLRAREDSLVYAIPFDVVIATLSSPDGLAFVAHTLRDRLVDATRTAQGVPEVRNVPVTSLIRRPPVFCDPDTTVRDVARTMGDEVVTAVLVQARQGLGIVTEADLRSKVLAAGVPPETPVRAVMTMPVTTIGALSLAPEAVLLMLQRGIGHLPVLDPAGEVLGVISAGSLMALDELSPFALHWSVAAAHDEEQLVKITAQLPAVFLGLMDARLDAASVMRVLTLHSDAVTRRLLELSFARHGQPPVDYSWFALGSGARNEMALSSDQDHALAYADTDDPSVDDFFGRVAADVHGGLLRCGYEADPSGVTAADYHWRMSESQWVDIFTRCLKTWDWRYLMRASLAFDFRCVAGGLLVEPRLREIVRRAAGHSGFLRRMARMAGEIRSPLGFRQRLPGRIDLKDSGLRPISNLARYYAFADGIGVSNTLERLAAARALGSRFADTAQSLSEAFVCISTLRLEHHATAVRAGTDLDDVVDADELRPLSAAELQEALRLVAAAQRRAIS